MKRFALLAAVALSPIAACSTSTPTPVAETAPAMPMLAQADTAFLNSAAQSGLAEVAAGKLASTQASRPAVKKFATSMVTQHTAVNDKLMALASSKGVTPPNIPDNAHQTMLDSMSSMKGRAFDRGYINGQITDHQAAVTLFQTEATSGTDPDVKAFAAQTLPAIQQHLAMARRLR